MQTFLSNISISKKLILGFIIPTVLIILLILTGINGLNSVKEDIEKIHQESIPKIDKANEVIDRVNSTLILLRDIIISDDQSLKENALKTFKETRSIIDKIFDDFGKMQLTEKEIEFIDQINRIRFDEYFPLRDKVANEILAGNKQIAIEMLFGDFEKIQNKYINALSEFIKLQEHLAQNTAEEARILTNRYSFILLVTGLLSLIFVITYGIILTKNIVVPVNLLKERLNSLANLCLAGLGKGLTAFSKGDFSVEVVKKTKHLYLNRKDEIGHTVDAFDIALTNAQAVIDLYENSRAILINIMGDLKKLINDSKEGKLDTRANAEKYEGSFKEILAGYNQVLDAIVLPLNESSKVLEVMATGDFTVRIIKDFKGQLQKLKDSINILGDSISDMLRKVKDNTEATGSAAAQISSSTEELASSSQELSSQVHEIASAIEQMASTIIQTTKNTTKTAENSKHAVNIAETGGKVILQTIDGIAKISNVINKSAEIIQELGKSSQQIGDIVQVINEIADQTNLLALNAAIEAARAGEQGRGFAVVADEVRKLAERTTKATKEIAEMIRKIQKDTLVAVDSVKEGTLAVEEGKKLAAEAGASLNQIISSANEVVDLTNQVASASEEQSSTAEQISKNIASISNVTNQAANGLQQISKAASDLNILTEALNNQVSQFKILDINGGNFYLRANGKIVKEKF